MKLNRPLLVTILAAVVLVGVALLIIPRAGSTAASSPVEIHVTHAAVQASSTTGSGLGTVRTFYVPIEVEGQSVDSHYLSGTLTTLAEKVDGEQELRASNLVFVFGDEANQLVVGGVSLYPPAGATLAVGAKTIRPVVGGSGTYDAAMGHVVSTNLGDEGWSHVFVITMG